MAGRLTFDVITQGEDNLGDWLILNALLEGGEIELIGADPIDG